MLLNLEKLREQAAAWDAVNTAVEQIEDETDKERVLTALTKANEIWQLLTMADVERLERDTQEREQMRQRTWAELRKSYHGTPFGDAHGS